MEHGTCMHIASALLILSWPDFPPDMHSCAENVFIKLTILVTPIKLVIY